MPSKDENVSQNQAMCLFDELAAGVSSYMGDNGAHKTESQADSDSAAIVMPGGSKSFTI